MTVVALWTEGEGGHGLQMFPPSRHMPSSSTWFLFGPGALSPGGPVLSSYPTGFVFDFDSEANTTSAGSTSHLLLSPPTSTCHCGAQRRESGRWAPSLATALGFPSGGTTLLRGPWGHCAVSRLPGGTMVWCGLCAGDQPVSYLVFLCFSKHRPQTE